MQSIRIGARRAHMNVPPVLRQGTFLGPQNVSALDISEDGRLIAVATMAFRQDRNLWLISGEGKLRSGRYLPLKQAGDETEITLCGLRIRPLFVPGHTVDSVAYMMEFNGRRVAFTGDIGFDAQNNILDRCWGDRDKAKSVVEVSRSKLIP